MSKTNDRLLSASEIARLAGVNRARVDQWTTRPDFPAPAETVVVGGWSARKWRQDKVTAWLVRGQMPLGRPSHFDSAEGVVRWFNVWETAATRYGYTTAGVPSGDEVEAVLRQLPAIRDELERTGKDNHGRRFADGHLPMVALGIAWEGWRRAKLGDRDEYQRIWRSQVPAGSSN